MKYQQKRFTVGGNIHEDGEAYRRHYDETFGEKDGGSPPATNHKGEEGDEREDVAAEESQR